MAKFDNDALNAMAKKVDLLEYASKTIDFRKRGVNNYAAHCPNHKDATPSLMINPEKNIFFCYSCKAGGNIFNWLRTYEKLSFMQAVKKVSAMIGCDLEELKQSETVAIYKNLRKVAEATNEPIERQTLPENYSMLFSDELPQEWLDEDMSAEVLREYKIKVDNASNRIVYPIYDNSGNLISVKGRTRYPQYKEMRLQKYKYYTKIGSNDFFVGMKENKRFITALNEVIIFEGIKSGLKLTTATGQRNWLSSETSKLNEAQIKILIRLHVKNIIVAYDSDVKLQSIKKQVSALKHFANVYAVINRNELLGEKESPMDRGIDVWNKLLEQKVRIT